jgi:hypothetical protein
LQAGERERRGSSYQFLSSAVLTAFAFEAYLNHVGPRVVACWESLEQLPPISKFDLVCELLKVDFQKGHRPRQTIEELFEFRNTMAHGRTEHIKPDPKNRDVNDKLDNYLGKRALARWESLIQTDDFAKRAREDVEAVFVKIHAAVPEPKEMEPKEALFAFGMESGSAVLICD